MYLQPYNNPRAGLYSLQTKLHRSTLNLATNNSFGSSVSLATTSIINEETNPQQDSSPPSAEALPAQSDASTSDSHVRRISEMSTESDFSSRSSSGSESSSGCSRRLSSSDLSLSNDPDASSSKGGKVALAAPRVPPRPNAQEILTRCTTMTRKAAMASRASCAQLLERGKEGVGRWWFLHTCRWLLWILQYISIPLFSLYPGCGSFLKRIFSLV